MSKVEHGLSGRLVDHFPAIAKVTSGLVREILPINDFDGRKVAFLLTTGNNREGSELVFDKDVKFLEIKPGDEVEVRRFPIGGRLRPADYLEKKEEGIGEKRKERGIKAGGKVVLGL